MGNNNTSGPYPTGDRVESTNCSLNQALPALPSSTKGSHLISHEAISILILGSHVNFGLLLSGSTFDNQPQNSSHQVLFTVIHHMTKPP